MKRELPALKDVCEILENHELVGAQRGTVEHSVGLVLIFSAFVGENQEQLEVMTALPGDVVKSIIFILRKNGVFGREIDHYADYFEDSDSGVVLGCDISCGQNLLKRGSKNGQAAWVMTSDGVDFTNQLIKENPAAREFLETLTVKFTELEAAHKKKNR